MYDKEVFAGYYTSYEDSIAEIEKNKRGKQNEQKSGRSIK